MYTGFVVLISCLLLTAWTNDKHQTASQNKIQSVAINTSEQEDEGTVIYITKEGFDSPDAWVGKTQPVTWINIDGEVHSVTDDYDEFDSGPLKPGERFTISFPHAGVWTYHDEFSNATGMISVMGRDE